jgi:hypothetical protein
LRQWLSFKNDASLRPHLHTISQTQTQTDTHTHTHSLSVCLSHMLAKSRQSQAHTVLRDCVKNASALQGPASSTSAYSIEVDTVASVTSSPIPAIPSHTFSESPVLSTWHTWLPHSGVPARHGCGPWAYGGQPPDPARHRHCHPRTSARNSQEGHRVRPHIHRHTDTLVSPTHTHTHTLTPTPTHTRVANTRTHAHAANGAGQPSEANAESGSLTHPCP